MAGDVRAAHAACIAALGALEGAATAALGAGAVDELRPLAARLIEARRLLEALPVDDAPPPHLVGSAGGGGLRRAVELCIWEVRARLRLLEGYASGASGAALDERKRTALLRLMRSLLARLNGEADPDPPTPPGARPTSPPLAPDATPPASSAPAARSSGSGVFPSSPASPLSPASAAHSHSPSPLSPSPSPSPLSPSPSPLAPSPSPPSAPSARSKLPKLNMGAAAAAALPQSVDELPQETPRSAFFMRREAPMPPPAATPRTRDETRRKAVAEGDAAVSAPSGHAFPSASGAAAATATVTATAAGAGSGGEVVMERDASGAWLVQGGAVTRLIERASAPDCADASFAQLFLLTFRTFLSPDLLLARLLERHALAPPDPCPERWKHDVLRPVQARVAALLRQWLDLEAADWCPALRPALAAARPALAAAGHDALVQRIDALLAQPAPAPPTPAPPPSPRGIGPSESFLALPPLDVARFLCRSDAALLAAVRHTELLSHGWARAEWADRCPALSKVIARFNALSHWLCSLVLTLDTPRLRAKMYARWVKIAVELRRQGDFAAVMAVVAALHNPAVARLKATLREVPRKRAVQVEELEALMRPTSNFRTYREALLLAPLPCVPYVGVFLTDLTFIEDGNPDWLAPGVVNFRKRRMLGEVLLLVQRLQSVPYAFPRSPAVDAFVEAQLGISHDVKRLFELSLQREPRQP